MSERKYAPQTVIRSQRRVLGLVRSYLSFMGECERATLRTDGHGLMTIDELLKHIDAAFKLKTAAAVACARCGYDPTTARCKDGRRHVYRDESRNR